MRASAVAAVRGAAAQNFKRSRSKVKQAINTAANGAACAINCLSDIIERSANIAGQKVKRCFNHVGNSASDPGKCLLKVVALICENAGPKS